MGGKFSYAVFAIVAVLVVGVYTAYVFYEEPQQPVSMAQYSAPISYTYLIDGSDYWGPSKQRRWVTQPAEDTSSVLQLSPMYDDGFYGRYSSYGYRDYRRRSGVCREYYTDPYSSRYGKCRDFYDQDNPYTVRDCDKYCNRNFDADFQKCRDTYEEGTREYHDCIDYYEELYSEYTSRCVAGCRPY